MKGAVAIHSYPESGVTRKGEQIERAGVVVMRAALALTLLWFGAMKFTSYEATNVAVFIANSPLLSWSHAAFGIQGASYMLGVVEVVAGVLLLAGFVSARLSVIGGAIGVITFVTTLSLMLSTPGVTAPLAGGFPALSSKPGQFLLKDLGLLGIALFIVGQALVRRRRIPPDGNVDVAGKRDDPRSVVLSIGTFVLRYGLALIFLWYGCMKFTSYEATGVAMFIMNNPLTSWWHTLLGVQGASNMLGTLEITTAILLAFYRFAPRASVAGGVMAVVTFAITLSFFFTTPGVAAPMGFPAISGDVGQFLLKDLGLLGISIWLLGRSLNRAAIRMPMPATIG